jgi:hypothetical protein
MTYEIPIEEKELDDQASEEVRSISEKRHTDLP